MQDDIELINSPLSVKQKTLNQKGEKKKYISAYFFYKFASIFTYIRLKQSYNFLRFCFNFFYRHFPVDYIRRALRSLSHNIVYKSFNILQ
jgi:hypothetical protein